MTNERYLAVTEKGKTWQGNAEVLSKGWNVFSRSGYLAAGTLVLLVLHL